MISRLFARSRLLFVTLFLAFAWAGTGGAPSHAQNLPSWAEPRDGRETSERYEAPAAPSDGMRTQKVDCDKRPNHPNCDDGEFCPSGNCSAGPPNKAPLSGQWILVLAALGFGGLWLYREDGRQLNNSEEQTLAV